MEFGGNARALEFFRSQGVRNGKVDYSGALAMQYRELLKSLVAQAVENRVECMSCDPSSVTIEADISLSDSMDSLRDDISVVGSVSDSVPVAAAPVAATPVAVLEAPVLPIQATSANTSRGLPTSRPKAQLIDDFDFDSVPTVISVKQPSPVVRSAVPLPAQYGGIIDPPAVEQLTFSSKPSSRGSSIDDFKEKGKEFMQKGVKASKDWYASLMHK